MFDLPISHANVPRSYNHRRDRPFLYCSGVFADLAPKTLRTARAQDERIRWATLMALTLLIKHRRELDALAEAFGRTASVDECVRAIEGAAQE